MYNKKTIVRKNPNNAVGVTAQRTLKRTGFGMYNLPRCEEVPGGVYFAKVKDVRWTTTRAGDPAIEVFYDIKYGIDCSNVINGRVSKDAKVRQYSIRQVYPVGTRYYDDFVDSMAESLGIDYDEEFDIEKVKGVTEWVKITYGDKSDLGGIEERCPMSWKEFKDLCREDSDDNQNDDNGNVEYSEEYVEEPEYDDSYDW